MVHTLLGFQDLMIIRNASLAALIMIAPHVQATEPRPMSMDISLVHSDNVGHARFDADRREDSALELDFSTSFQPAWKTRGLFTFDLWAGADRHERFNGLNQIRVGMTANYRQRFGLGPQAAWWNFDTRVGWHDFQDGKRDGLLGQMGVAAGKSWQSGLQLKGRLGYEQRWSRGGTLGRAPQSTFDLSSWHAGLDLDYPVAARWGLFAELDWRRGEFNTSTRSKLALLVPWTFDNTFGTAFRTYRINADASTARVGLRVDLSPATQLLASVETMNARARTGPATYDGTTLSLQVQHDF